MLSGESTLKILSWVLLFLFSATIGCKKRFPIDTRLQDYHAIQWLVGKSPQSQLPELHYEPDLYAFMTEFIASSEEYGVDITDESIQTLRIIRWTDKLVAGDGPGVLAACTRYYIADNSWLSSTPQIAWSMIEVLNAAKKEYTGENRILLRELVYHELTHCLMRKGHLPDGVSGIMSPTFSAGNQRAILNWPKLLEDNFSPYFLSLMPDI